VFACILRQASKQVKAQMKLQSLANAPDPSTCLRCFGCMMTADVRAVEKGRMSLRRVSLS
jgi:hypothetical protein